MLQLPIANTVIAAIVKHQREIIGPLALEQAKKVPGIVVDNNAVSIQDTQGNPEQIIVKLVAKYEELFGQTSIEVCKDAIKELRIDIPKRDLPSILQ